MEFLLQTKPHKQSNSERETVSESDAVFGNLNTPYTLLDLEKFMFELTLLLWFAQQPYYFRVILWPCIS